MNYVMIGFQWIEVRWMSTYMWWIQDKYVKGYGETLLVRNFKITIQLRLVESSSTMTHLNNNFGFWNVDDLDEDDIPLGWEGMTQDAESYSTLLKQLNRTYIQTVNHLRHLLVSLGCFNWKCSIVGDKSSQCCLSY